MYHPQAKQLDLNMQLQESRDLVAKYDVRSTHIGAVPAVNCRSHRGGVGYIMILYYRQADLNGVLSKEEFMTLIRGLGYTGPSSYVDGAWKVRGIFPPTCTLLVMCPQIFVLVHNISRSIHDVLDFRSQVYDKNGDNELQADECARFLTMLRCAAFQLVLSSTTLSGFIRYQNPLDQLLASAVRRPIVACTSPEMISNNWHARLGCSRSGLVSHVVNPLSVLSETEHDVEEVSAVHGHSV